MYEMYRMKQIEQLQAGFYLRDDDTDIMIGGEDNDKIGTRYNYDNQINPQYWQFFGLSMVNCGPYSANGGGILVRIDLANHYIGLPLCNIIT